MSNRVQLSRMIIVCFVCLSSTLLWARGGSGGGGAKGGVASGGAGGLRGGATSAPHSNPGPAPRPGSSGPASGRAAGGSPTHGAVGIHGNQPTNGQVIGGNRVSDAPRRDVSHNGEVHREAARGGEVHREAMHMGERRLEGPHGRPGPYRAEMLHSTGAHWNGYHQAYLGNHAIFLARAGYYPSYYYHPWYHGPWGGTPWGWGWGFGPGVTFGLGGSGWNVNVGTGWGYPAYYGPYGQYGYWGRPLGWGFGGWGLGTTVYSSGYYVYENPYYSPVMYPTVVYDYSRPIPVMAQALQRVPAGSQPGAPPPEGPPMQDNPEFDAARESFKLGNYSAALSLVDSAIRNSQSDAVMHEFRSLVLFAVRDYRQSAAVAHSVLAVGPGWDYTTMSSLYPNPFVYSDQLRVLEGFTRANPRAADAHFLLAYHNMINSRKEGAVEELQQVIHLMPNDRLAKELLAMVQGPPQAVPAAQMSQASAPFRPKTTFDGSSFDAGVKPGLNDRYTNLTPPAKSPAAPAPVPAPEAVDKALLAGTWNASRGDGSKFRLTLTEEGKFHWTFSAPNQKGEELSGNYTLDGPVLILERKEGGALAGTANFAGDEQMNFKLVGAPPEDKGLDFEKSS
jgi:tetratricopeptide (TPR) repeat protein